MLTREQAKRLCRKILGFSNQNRTEVMVVSGESALTRFAKNSIIQNVSSASNSVAVKVVTGGRVGLSSTDKMDDASLKDVVRRAADSAKAATPVKGLPPMVGPREFRKVKNYSAATAKLGPEARAKAIRYIAGKCRRAKLECAGIYSSGQKSLALANSRGLFAYDSSTNAEFSVTVLTKNSAGWAEASNRDCRKIDTGKLSDVAFEKAVRGKTPKRIPSGKYTVILEPAAVTDFLLFMSGGFSGRQYKDGVSFLAGRLGKRLFGKNITIGDEAFNPEIGGMPFDFEGTPRRDTVLVEKGVVKTLTYDLRTAREMKTKPTGHALLQPNPVGSVPWNLVVAGGDSSIEEMIKSTKRGVLVTHFHYTNLAERRELVLTGMTRDGTFLVENGKIRHPVKNMRFTQSVIEALKNVEMISKERVSASAFFGGSFVVPAMKIKGFNFSSATEF